MGRPKIAFFSSKEAQNLLSPLILGVTQGDWALPEAWTDSVFELGTSNLESLRRVISGSEFAVLLFTPDDVVRSRQSELDAPRDNLVFELGMATAQLDPKRVVVVVPQESPLKIPTDYAGHKWATYDPSDGKPAQYLARVAAELRAHFQDVCRRESRSAESNIPSTRQVTGLAMDELHLSPGEVIPICRNLASSLDWFQEMESSLGRVLPSLDPMLSYFGPGLAKNWIRENQASSPESAESEIEAKRQFHEMFRNVLGKFHADNVNVVDVGIGDFEKGHEVLSQLMRDSKVHTINYFAVDISYEMLLLALSPRTAPPERVITLRRLLRREGKIVGINAEFRRLKDHRFQFMPPCRNLFIFLGNTIGNELDEIGTLESIAACMEKDDRLLADLQLAEDRPRSDEEATKAIQDDRFFVGPFLAIGCARSDIDLYVRRDDAESQARGIDALTYKIICHTRRRLEARSVAFESGTLAIPRADICTFIVRKYREEVVEGIFQRAGLEVVHMAATPKTSDPSARRWCFILAKRRSDGRPGLLP